MQWKTPRYIAAHSVLTASGWQNDVTLELDTTNGTVKSIKPGITPSIPVYDLLLPGMPNVHSHAFQRAMAGLTERASGAERDSFWTWRNLMYQFLERLNPEQILVIARWLYIEMLKGGYTRVGEFHYLHNQPNGSSYDDVAVMAMAILEAAQETGIGLTLLPVHYATSDFGGKSPLPGQRRFLQSSKRYLHLLDRLNGECFTYSRPNNPIVLGIAPHSLRAVTPDMMRDVLGGLHTIGLQDCPKHIHVSEQRKEVDTCLAWSGKRPVEWMLDNMPVDDKWCFIHATHMSDSEVTELAKSGVVAGLCPTTEANLGDGVFPAVAFLRAGGKFALGTDSHISVNVSEELRFLEYGQRLAQQSRACLSEDVLHASCGERLWRDAVRGGSQALGRPAEGIAEGSPADLVACSMKSPLFAGKTADGLLDTAIFALPSLPVSDVWVGGRQLIEEGKHPLEEQAAEAYARALKELAE